MKKFLTSALKIGLGVFIGFVLLVVAVAIILPDSATDNTATLVENTATNANVAEAPATVPTETETLTKLEDAKVEEDENTPKNSNNDVEAEYQEKLAEQEEEIPEAESNQISAPTTTKGTVFDYATWDYYQTSAINEYTKAPSGKQYYVVTVHFDNKGTDTYNTNAFYWTLTADGITYTTDVATYSMPDYKLVDIGPGGKTDAQFVFLVDGTPTNLALNYDPL